MQSSVSTYEDVLFSEDDRGLSAIDVLELHENPRLMLMILRAAVSLELARSEDESDEFGTGFRSGGPKELARNITKLESMQQKLWPYTGDAKTMMAFHLAQVWADEGEE